MQRNARRFQREIVFRVAVCISSLVVIIIALFVDDGRISATLLSIGASAFVWSLIESYSFLNSCRNQYLRERLDFYRLLSNGVFEITQSLRDYVGGEPSKNTINELSRSVQELTSGFFRLRMTSSVYTLCEDYDKYERIIGTIIFNTPVSKIDCLSYIHLFVEIVESNKTNARQSKKETDDQIKKNNISWTSIDDMKFRVVSRNESIWGRQIHIDDKTYIQKFIIMEKFIELVDEPAEDISLIDFIRIMKIK